MAWWETEEMEALLWKNWEPPRDARRALEGVPVQKIWKRLGLKGRYSKAAKARLVYRLLRSGRLTGGF
jgi:hypothetical protein